MSTPSHAAISPPSLVRYRWTVFMRCVLACMGGYTLSAIFSAAFGLLAVHAWGMSKVDAVTLATMLSFLVWTTFIITVFALHHARMAWLCWFSASTLLALTVWHLYGGAA